MTVILDIVAGDVLDAFSDFLMSNGNVTRKVFNYLQLPKAGEKDGLDW